MAGPGKLRRLVGTCPGWQVWAGHVQKNDHGLQPCKGRSLRKAALVSGKEGHHENMDASDGEG